VAIDAGLSVPYVANLEAGRGNPTLAVLEGLASALGIPMAALIGESDLVADASLPAGLDAFCRSRRFKDELRRLGADMRQPLISALAACGAGAPRRLTELDWNRLLDALVLTYRAARDQERPERATRASLDRLARRRAVATASSGTASSPQPRSR